MTPSGTSRRPTDRAGLRAALRRPPDAISLGDGFSLPTRWRTISRWQRALLDRDEFPLLQRQAEQRAARVAPNPHRMLLAIVCGIDAAATDEAGRRVPAVSRLLPAEVDTCRRHFANFMTQVFVGSGGALRVEATELVLDEPARQMSAVGENHWWLSPADAFAGRESVIPGDTFDSIAVLYKMPPRVAPALHGGAVGRDPGLRGSAAWSLWVTDWAEAPGFFNSTTIAALHEWLHNVSFYAHRVMGDRAVPDCHAGEEYGYWDTDGGYRQWQAWNRDLMLHYIPPGFWTRLTARGRLLPPDGAQHRGLFDRLLRWLRRPERRLHRWCDVGAEWMRQLPCLEDEDLRRWTGLGDLQLTVEQAAPNTAVVWSVQTAQPVPSPYSIDPLGTGPALDNVLALGRLPQPAPPEDAVDAYRRAPLEGLAWLRSPRAPRENRDLVLVRPDLAPHVLPRLSVAGRPGQASVIGYVSRRDPAEGHPMNLVAAVVDFGEVPPRDELDAIGL